MAHDLKMKFSVEYKEISEAEREINGLAAALKKGDITQQKYSKSVGQVASRLQSMYKGNIAARNSVMAFSRSVLQSKKQVDSETSSLVKNTSVLNANTKVLRQATNQSKAYAQAQRMSGKSTNRFGMYAQQVGYQVGDFFVQVQSGTNGVLAFGQQATQLAGLLPGLAGAILGISISVGTMLVGNFIRASESVNKLNNKIKDLKEEVRSLEAGGIPTEVLDALNMAEDLNLKRIKAELELARAKDVVLDLEIQHVSESSLLYQNALSRVVAATDELKIAQDIEASTHRLVSEFQELQKDRDAATEKMKVQAEIGRLATAVLVGAGVSFNKEITAIQKKAAETALFLGISFEKALGISQLQALNVGDGVYSGRGEDPRIFERPASREGYKRKPKRSTVRDPLKDLQKRIALDTKLLGVSREQAQVERAIANSKIKYSDQEIANTVKELEVYNLKLARIKETQALYGTVQSSLESGFMAMVDGTKSVEDAFKDMAKSVIAELYRVLVVKRMVGSFEAGTGIMGFLGGIFGKASGGTVMSGTPYLVGEKGPELIVPQNRGHVMNADLTAKAMNGSKGETVVVNQTINVSTGVQQTVRSEIKQLMPQIAQSAKSAVVDAKRRGGSYGRAFS